ncbi:MAG TPA: hypothetical protein DCQ98_09090 [Planctomycetaceae bacterium]|nr:hypothetical protein [Planctomycetaceae bacterium]HRF02202.1 hypothetical protein [Pirellulaceae bacterium]
MTVPESSSTAPPSGDSGAVDARAADAPPPIVAPMRLRIGPVVRRAEEIDQGVAEQLPGHSGLRRAAQGVARAAHEAERVSRDVRKLFGMHRLPVWFLLGAILLFGVWFYSEFLHVTKLSLALPDRDAVLLRSRLQRGHLLAVRQVEVPGSREAAEQVIAGRIDLAFVQGGIPIPPSLQRLELPRSEWAICLLREGRRLADVRRLLTSSEREGSHSVAIDWFRTSGLPIPEFVHDWSRLTDDGYELPSDVDGVFVVKDLGADETLARLERLEREGFRPTSLPVGARGLTLDYLVPSQIPRGYLRVDPPLPAEALETPQIRTYLVARAGLTPKLLASAAHLLDSDVARIEDGSFELDVSTTSEMLQGIEAFLGIFVYIGLAFLTLLGLEVMTYRRRFNELNTLVSLISMHQSNKDVLGVEDPALRQNNLTYLGTCSDLLGLIGVIAGYYAQENGSLLFNGLLTVVVERADALRLNIQLKILHASIRTLGPAQLDVSSGEVGGEIEA